MAVPRPRRSKNAALVRTGAPVVTLPDLPTEWKGAAVKVEEWGKGNKLPQEVLRVLYDSGTATTCTERLEQFIVGRGFADAVTGATMVNPGQTLNQLLAEAGAYAAVGLGVAYIVRCTYGGQVAQVYVVAVDCLRREKDGERFVVNPKLSSGGTVKAADNEVYLPFDPTATEEEISAEVVAAAGSEEGYWGHLWFSFTRKVGRGRYPVPAWWSAKEAIEADAEVPKYDLKQFRNGFFPDAVMTVIGKRFVDEVPADLNWQPAQGQTYEDQPMVESPDLVNFKAQVKDLKGSSSKASVLVLAVEADAEKPQLDFLDKGPNSKNLSDATNRIEGRVYRRFGVPPVLCGVAEAGQLGSNQQIVNSIQLFSLVVEPARELCVGPLRRLFPDLDFTVAPLDPVDYIDPAVAAVMTPDELRAIRNLPATEKPEDSEAERTLKALNGLSPLVATKVLDTMSEDEVRGLVGLPPKPTNTPRPRQKS